MGFDRPNPIHTLPKFLTNVNCESLNSPRTVVIWNVVRTFNANGLENKVQSCLKSDITKSFYSEAFVQPSRIYISARSTWKDIKFVGKLVGNNDYL